VSSKQTTEVSDRMRRNGGRVKFGGGGHSEKRGML